MTKKRTFNAIDFKFQYAPIRFKHALKNNVCALLVLSAVSVSVFADEMPEQILSEPDFSEPTIPEATNALTSQNTDSAFPITADNSAANVNGVENELANKLESKAGDSQVLLPLPKNMRNDVSSENANTAVQTGTAQSSTTHSSTTQASTTKSGKQNKLETFNPSFNNAIASRPAASAAIRVSQFEATAKTAQDVREAIDRMVQAVQTLNYRGVFVYKNGTSLNTMQIAHKASVFGEQERLLSLDGKPMEMVRNNDSVICFLPQLDGTVVASSQPRNPFTVVLPRDIDSLSKNYKLEPLGLDRVAGRPAQVVAMLPNDEYRYGYKLWLDIANHMLLKVQVGVSGKPPIETMMFTVIEYPVDIRTEELVSHYANYDPAKLKAASNSSSIQNKQLHNRLTSQVASENSGQAGNSVSEQSASNSISDKSLKWSVNKLPDGFEATEQKPQKISAIVNTEFEHLIFSDGLASISVFISEYQDKENSLQGRAQIGALNAYGRVIGDHQITVIGDVPLATVAMVADSVKIQ